MMLNLTNLLTNVTNTDISNDPLLLTARIITLVLAVPSFILNLFLILVLWFQSSRHFNSRLIIANISTAALLTASYQLCKSSVFFLSYSEGSSFSDYGPFCSLREFINSTCLRGAMLCMLGCAVERIVATKFHRTYESGFRWLGILIMTLIWVQAVPGSVFSTVFNFVSPAVFPYCEYLLVVDRNVLATYLCLLSIGDVVALLLCVAALKVSQRKIARFQNTQSPLSLTSRMELIHCVRSAAVLFPACVLHFLILEFILLWVLLIRYILPLSSMNIIALLDVVDVLFQFYFAAHAILVLVKLKSAGAELLQRFPPTRVIGKRLVQQSGDCGNAILQIETIAMERVIGAGAGPYRDFLENFWDMRLNGKLMSTSNSMATGGHSKVTPITTPQSRASNLNSVNIENVA